MRAADGKPLLEELQGIKHRRPPIWMMRQAGRYLPEYREVRERAQGFLKLCYTPSLAAEVTLQPLRRFDLDAAIIFSDILVIPHALGQKVDFEPGEGPVLGPLSVDTTDPGLVVDRLEPVLDALDRVSSQLEPSKALIGFCGGPWTVATYMIGGRGSPDQAAAKLFALQKPDYFTALMEILIEVSIAYLVAQFRAGADVVQIFESWAGNLDSDAFRDRVLLPNWRIVQGVRRQIPGAPIIGFPRGAAAQLGAFVADTDISAVGLDQSVPPNFADTLLPAEFPVQGNLDPLRLVVGGTQMDDAARSIIAAFDRRPHIFNLGHGILPETPIGNVERLIKVVREG